MLQTQIDKFKVELSSSRETTQELEKTVSELQPFKEQARVSTDSACFTYMFMLVKHLNQCTKIMENYKEV